MFRCYPRHNKSTFKTMTTVLNPPAGCGRADSPGDGDEHQGTNHRRASARGARPLVQSAVNHSGAAQR